tara:strand:+ start:16672 stop:17262 length:591 start_codon:yes stop_codon:yes gene_type:complete
MGFIIETGGGAPPAHHKYLNETLINPTVGNYTSASGYTQTDKLWAVPYSLDSKLIINGCTIEKGTAGSGNLTTAIYKYNTSTALWERVENTNINTWNTAATGLQTVTITDTTLLPGIYLNVLIADTASVGNHSSYTTQFLDTPAGLDSTGARFMGMVKASYTYVSELPSTFDSTAAFWTFSTSYYSKFASFLLNHA